MLMFVGIAMVMVMVMVVSVLNEVAGAATETRTSAQTVLSASQSVEAAVSNLRSEVETFLVKVAI
jgi:methyl-accepting chemotaxis protein